MTQLTRRQILVGSAAAAVTAAIPFAAPSPVGAVAPVVGRQAPGFYRYKVGSKVYDMLVAEKMLVQGFHYPFPALAHVEKTSTSYREVPVVWNPTI